MKKIIQSNRGSAYFDLMIFLIIFLMLGGIVMETLRIENQVRQVKSGAEAAITALATDYWDEVFKSTREGYSGAYQRGVIGWQAVFENERVREEISEVLGLNEQGEKEAEHGHFYRLSEVTIEEVNTLFREKSQVLKIKGKIKVQIPWKAVIAGIPDLEVTVNIESAYQMKF